MQFVHIFLIFNVCGYEVICDNLERHPLRWNTVKRYSRSENLLQKTINKYTNFRGMQYFDFNRIVGGSAARIEDYPFTACLARIKPELEFRGGAVIISKYWATTAAHCMSYISHYEIDQEMVFVRSNSSYWNKNYKEHLVIGKYTHEKFSFSTVDYDIALVRVKQPFTAAYEKPIHLPKASYKYVDNSTASVLGWGTTAGGTINYFVVDELRVVNISLINYDYCKQLPGEFGARVTDRMVCAGDVGKDSCSFDSGGPLIQNNHLIGLVSWGPTLCADETEPGVYTRVSIFHSWIEKTMRNKYKRIRTKLKKKANNSNSSDNVVQPLKRIIGGKLAKIEDFPSTTCLILQGTDGDDFRGGAVIANEYWAITAGHCMSYISSKDIKNGIAFVRSNSVSWIHHYTEHQIIHSITHEQFNAVTTDYDIALVKVKKPFKASHEKPVKLPSANYKYVDNSMATVVGWGTTDSNAIDPFVVTNLRFVNIKVLNHKSCQLNYRNVGELVTERMVCAGAPGKDACVYDSGGPMYQDNFLIGLVSWGSTKCADDVLPGIYTRVSLFTKWIIHRISSDSKIKERSMRRNVETNITNL